MIGLNRALLKILGGLIALGVVAGGISWWSMTPVARSGAVDTLGRVGGWTGCVLLLPFLLFLLVGKVSRLESNAAGMVLVGLLTSVELAGLGWLFDWSIQGASEWTGFTLAGFSAGLYNTLACDWVAEKFG